MIREIIAHRSLLYQLIIKELKLRYARPALGFIWAFLSPLLLALIFYLVFAKILKGQVQEAPFFLYLITGILTWSFFSDSVAASTASLVVNKNLIRESRFPQHLIPCAIVLANAVNFIPTLSIVVVASAIILKGLPFLFVLLPLAFFIQLCATLGVSILVSLWYVKWRDVKYIVDSCLLLLLYLTPSFYSLLQVKGVFPQWVYALYLHNPLVSILFLYRVSCLKGFYLYMAREVSLVSVIVTAGAGAAVLLWCARSLYYRWKDSINDYLSY
jgi:ABC-type polysaccharide/polyol phosphate export permease